MQATESSGFASRHRGAVIVKANSFAYSVPCQRVGAFLIPQSAAVKAVLGERGSEAPHPMSHATCSGLLWFPTAPQHVKGTCCGALWAQLSTHVLQVSVAFAWLLQSSGLQSGLRSLLEPHALVAHILLPHSAGLFAFQRGASKCEGLRCGPVNVCYKSLNHLDKTHEVVNSTEIS